MTLHGQVATEAEKNRAELLRVGRVIPGDEHLEARLSAAADRAQVGLAQDAMQALQRLLVGRFDRHARDTAAPGALPGPPRRFGRICCDGRTVGRIDLAEGSTPKRCVASWVFFL